MIPFIQRYISILGFGTDMPRVLSICTQFDLIPLFFWDIHRIFVFFLLAEFHYFSPHRSLPQLNFQPFPSVFFFSFFCFFSSFTIPSESPKILSVATSRSCPDFYLILFHILPLKVINSSNFFFDFLYIGKYEEFSNFVQSSCISCSMPFFIAFSIVSLVLSASQLSTFVDISGSSHSSHLLLKLAPHLESFLLLIFLTISFRHTFGHLLSSISFMFSK